MEAKKVESNFVSFLSDTLLVAFLTLVGYATTFLYERGFNQTFGIPSYFIEINVSKILLAIGVVGATLLIFAYCIEGLLLLGGYFNAPKIIARKIAFLAPFLLIACLKLASDFHNWKSWLPFFIFIAVWVLSRIVYPIAKHRGIKKIEDRFKEFHKKKNPVTQAFQENSIFLKLLDRMGIGFAFLVMVSMLSMLVANDLGKLDANTRTVFGVIGRKQGNSLLVLNRAGDFLVTMPLADDGLALQHKIVPVALSDFIKNDYEIQYFLLGKIGLEKPEHCLMPPDRTNDAVDETGSVKSQTSSSASTVDVIGSTTSGDVINSSTSTKN